VGCAMSLPSLGPRGLQSKVSTSGFSVPRSVSSTTLVRHADAQLDWGGHKRQPRGSPYAVNFSAECERIEEEHRVRQEFETRRLKREDQMRENMRQDIVDQARKEELESHKLHQQKIAVLEEQKRLKAQRGVKLADERHKREKSVIHRRFYDPTVEVLQQRDREWEQRRVQRTHELQERMKKVEMINEQRRQEDLRKREERREHVYQRSLGQIGGAPQLLHPQML